MHMAEPRFVMNDVWHALGSYLHNGKVHATMALKTLNEDEVDYTWIAVNHIVGLRKARFSIVSESGLYNLIMRSSKVTRSMVHTPSRQSRITLSRSTGPCAGLSPKRNTL